MCPQKIAVIYNKPVAGRYSLVGEEKAELGVLDSVRAVHRALGNLGYAVARVPLSPPLEKTRETLKGLKVDLIFNLFEGFVDSPEAEATIADTLAELGIPYTGCPGAILALALDKARTKALLAANGIRTPKYQVLTPETVASFQMNYPCIIKPVGEDASHGVSADSVVNDAAALARQVTKISQLYGGRALVEEYVDGREFNITVLGTSDLDVLPISEIVFLLPPGLPRILTFEAKWEPKSPYFESTKPICPADIHNELKEEIGNVARQVFRLLGGSGYIRVDLRMNDKRQLYVIEVNPNPDISPGTGAARQSKASGMNYRQFIDKLIQLALERETQCK